MTKRQKIFWYGLTTILLGLLVKAGITTAYHVEGERACWQQVTEYKILLSDKKIKDPFPLAVRRPPSLSAVATILQHGLMTKHSVPKNWFSQNRKDYISGHVTVLKSLAENKNMLTTDDLKREEDRARKILSELRYKSLLSYDTDKNKKISRQELDEGKDVIRAFCFGIGAKDECQDANKTTIQYLKNTSDYATYLSLDKNGDGMLVESEMLNTSDIDIGTLGTVTRNLEIIGDYLALDPGNDGTLSVKELEKIAGDVFDLYDVNIDKIITEDELHPYVDGFVFHPPLKCTPSRSKPTDYECG